MIFSGSGATPETPQRVIVCGGRMFGVRWFSDGSENEAWAEERALLTATLDSLHIAELAHGNAKGADTLAAGWARANGVSVRSYPAAWVSHGNAAGPIRNQWMLDDFKPDTVVAFPGGIGTRDMKRRAAKAAVNLLIVAAALDVSS